MKLRRLKVFESGLNGTLRRKFLPGFFYTVFFLSLLSCSREKAPEIPGMVYIPSGKFMMGSEEVDTEALGKEFGLRKGRYYEDEAPKRKVFLKGFYMDIYEVTNRQYKEFVEKTGYPPPQTWENGAYPEGEGDYPAANVTWHDANNYCGWVNKRLPTEEEWEKAARGPKGNIYPWGNEYDPKKANLETEKTAAVGSYQTDRSYYGVYDMGGNVMEWVDSWYERYPGNNLDNKDYGKQYKVLRGGVGGQSGHYVINKIYARGSNRNYYLPEGAGRDGGFRCAKSPARE